MVLLCLRRACYTSLHKPPHAALQVKLRHVLSIVQTVASHRVPRLAPTLLNVLLLPIMITQEATGRGCRARPVCMVFFLTDG